MIGEEELRAALDLGNRYMADLDRVEEQLTALGVDAVALGLVAVETSQLLADAAKLGLFRGDATLGGFGLGFMVGLLAARAVEAKLVQV